MLAYDYGKKKNDINPGMPKNDGHKQVLLPCVFIFSCIVKEKWGLVYLDAHNKCVEPIFPEYLTFLFDHC